MKVKSIQEVSDADLAQLVKNYKKYDKVEGGMFPLSEIYIEQRYRIKTDFSAEQIFEKILECSLISDDGFVTYLQLWTEFYKKPWKATHSVNVVMDMMGKVIGYCVDKRLPIVTTLIVRTANRKYTPKAAENIYSECRMLGMKIGDVSAKEFCRLEKEKSLEFARKLSENRTKH